MKVSITDAVADPYLAIAEKQGRSVDVVVDAQLKRFSHLPPGEKAIVLGGQDLLALEERLRGPIRDGIDLADKVARLAGVRFRNIQLDFSATQLEELTRRATRQGRPVDTLVQEIVAAIVDQFFYTSGDGVALVKPTPVKKEKTPTTAAASPPTSATHAPASS